MPIVQRTPPLTGRVSGKAVAKDENHIAVAMTANRYIVLKVTELGRDVEVGERLSLLFSRGQPCIDHEGGWER